MATFFRRIRNALSHKNIEFDSDSLVLSDVTVTLKDRKQPTMPFNWEVAMTAQDLRAVGVYLGNEIVAKCL